MTLMTLLAKFVFAAWVLGAKYVTLVNVKSGVVTGPFTASKKWPRFKNWLKNCRSGCVCARGNTPEGIERMALITWIKPPVQGMSCKYSACVSLND